MTDNIKFKSFEDAYDYFVIIKSLEKIIEALEKGEFAMANSIVKFLDSSLVYLTDEDYQRWEDIITIPDIREMEKKIKKFSKGDKNKIMAIRNIVEYRRKDDNVSHLKLSSDVKKSVMESIGIKNLDKSYVLWHEVYSKWLRELVRILYLYGKIGSSYQDVVIS